MLVIKILEMIGTIAFAIAGALVGIRRKMDSYGVIILAIATALAGGLIRDVIIGSIPPFFLREPLYTGVSIASALLTIYMYKRLKKYNDLIQFFDALGLAAFTAIGNEVAISHGYDSFFVIVVLGILTGTGGGMVRDVLAQEIPFVCKQDIYAVASLIGGLVFYFTYLKVSLEFAMYASCLVTFLVRFWSYKNDIHLKIIDDGKTS